MEQTEKSNEKRTCANCANGPEPSDDCETCEDRDKWSPIEKGQLDLEGNPLPDPQVEDYDETEVLEYAVYRSSGLVFRMRSEALDKALDLRKKESVNDRKNRIKILVQNKSKIIRGTPLDPGLWDAGTNAIYERIMTGHGIDP